MSSTPNTLRCRENRTDKVVPFRTTVHATEPRTAVSSSASTPNKQRWNHHRNGKVLPSFQQQSTTRTKHKNKRLSSNTEAHTSLALAQKWLTKHLPLPNNSLDLYKNHALLQLSSCLLQHQTRCVEWNQHSDGVPTGGWSSQGPTSRSLLSRSSHLYRFLAWWFRLRYSDHWDSVRQRILGNSSKTCRIQRPLPTKGPDPLACICQWQCSVPDARCQMPDARCQMPDCLHRSTYTHTYDAYVWQKFLTMSKVVLWLQVQQSNTGK